MAILNYIIVGFSFIIIIYKIFKNLLNKKIVITNPFAKDDRIPLKEKVIDQKLRDNVLKQGFSSDKIPKDLDAIIIGSGIGGLTTAAIMAKVGKKVLVLEQHDQAGGCCHTFIEKGYEFDVGIHYIGEVNRPTMTRTLIEQISEGQIEWEDLRDDFDHVIFDSLSEKPRDYKILSNIEHQKRYLKECFPDEEKAIDRYYEIINDIRRGYGTSFLVKFIPLVIVKILNKLNLLKFFSNFWSWNQKTVKEALEELTSNEDLRAIFCYCFGDYGTAPSKASFSFNSLLMAHFSKGASYPIGGASEIAYNIIPVIEKGGGKVLVRAKVLEILVNEGRACGVSVKHGTKTYECFAPLIISDAGAYNTFDKMLPLEIASKSRIWPLLRKSPHGAGAMSVFIGLDTTREELGIEPKTNYWIYTQNDIDKITVDYLELSKDEFEEKDIPLLFLSFPSTKDPTWEKRYPGRSTMVVVTLANYDWYSDWLKNPVTRRGDDYEAIKKSIGHKVVEQCSKLFPKICDHIDYISIGSPLSNNYYLGSPKGEIYGLDHTNTRFSAQNSSLLRPETDIPNLYLTGQDICSCGFTGALWGGLMCAQQILGRNVLNDLIKLHKGIRKQKKLE